MKKELALVPSKYFDFQRTGVVIKENTPIDEWLRIGEVLKKANAATQWWIGDWLNFGEREYGEKYSQALEATDYDYSTLRDFSWVAGRIGLSSRNDNLTFKHHRVVASLEKHEQNKWLKKADKEQWSTSQLKDAIEKEKEVSNNWLRLYSQWSFQDCDPHYGSEYPGRIPGQLIKNILYYWTNENDIIVDPFGGSGTTIDVCEEMKRKYFVYDLKPSRKEIKKHNILDGFPDECKNCDLIFLDPPYWKMKDDGYPDGSISRNKNVKEFYGDLNKIFKDAHTVLKNDGILAFLMMPMYVENKFFDLSFEGAKRIEQNGFQLIYRIQAPLSTQQYNQLDVARFKENKKLMNISRDLWIFKKD